MAISDRRVRYVDKENEVLVKDFSEINDNEYVYSNVPDYVFDDNAIAEALKAVTDLNNLQQGFMNIINSISDGVVTDFVIANVIKSLSITAGNFGSLTNILNIIKNSNDKTIKDFMGVVIRDVSNSLYDNPSLLDNYKGMSEDISTQVLLYSLNNYGDQLTSRLTNPSFTPSSYTANLVDLGYVQNNSPVTKLVTGLGLSQGVVNQALPLLIAYATYLPYFYSLYILNNKINEPIVTDGYYINNNYITNNQQDTDSILNDYYTVFQNDTSVNRIIDIYYSEVFCSDVTESVLDYTLLNVSDPSQIAYILSTLQKIHDKSIKASGSLYLKLTSLNKYYDIMNTITDFTDIDSLDSEETIKLVDRYIDDTIQVYFLNVNYSNKDDFNLNLTSLTCCLLMSMLTNMFKATLDINLTTVNTNKLLNYLKDMSKHFRFFLTNLDLPYINSQKTLEKNPNTPLGYMIDIYKEINNDFRIITISNKDDNIKNICINLYKFLQYLNNTDINYLLSNTTNSDDKQVVNKILSIKNSLTRNTVLQTLITDTNFNTEVDYLDLLDLNTMYNIQQVILKDFKKNSYPKTFFNNYTSDISRVRIQATSISV